VIRTLLTACCVVVLLNAQGIAQEQPTPAQPPPNAERLPAAGPNELEFREFSAITTDITKPPGTLPVDYSDQLFQETHPDEPSPVLIAAYYWDAPEIWYHPLYFDDVQLERYGQTRCPTLQPVFSAAHFFGTIPILPYKMGLDSPHGYVTNLGYYRPGSPTPCIGRRLPWEYDAAAYEAGTVLGLIFLLP